MPGPSSTHRYPPVDRLGRPQPRRFTWLTAIRAVPWVIQHFDREVPDDFWAVESLTEDGRVMAISCPCGETPTVVEASCVECECGRFYLNLGERIKVARP